MGWTLKELQEQNVDIFAEAYPDPSYRQEVLDFVAAATGEWVDLKIKVRDGRVIDAACAVVHLSDGTKVAIAQDITERKQAEDALRRSEDQLRLVIDTIPMIAWTVRPDGVVDFVNQRWLDYTGLAWDEYLQDVTAVVHPEDKATVIEKWLAAMEAGEPYEAEMRLRRADGEYRWFLVRVSPFRDKQGVLIKWYGVSIDIEDRKQAEALVHAKDQEFRAIVENAPDQIIRYDREFRRTYVDPAVAREYGLPLEALTDRPVGSVIRDAILNVQEGELAQLKERIAAVFDTGKSYEYEMTWPSPRGRRCYSVRYFPELDLDGSVVAVLGISRDITERKQTEDSLREALLEINTLKDQLYQENVALREEITSTSMFEEIVGTPPVLKQVLALVTKVAPTDSTVLITGETGTGKELIARAIHKKSNRAGRVFITVHCAAIPTSLIASELFGHEKGAFTGAIQQRLGRFELAEGGTIFLDEIGELPPETQIALLRVLQENEFERVGGTKTIRANVRVIAATNRDLNAAIDSGSFRSDLFYRLNVFPIEVPSLRERKEDIPSLVEYFVNRYANKMGKKMRRINKGTLEMLASYDWPGNIRELQNVIERSVILSETENFTVDKSWLSHKARHTHHGKALTDNLTIHQKEMIEAALAESQGRVSGRSGAAAIPWHSTLYP